VSVFPCNISLFKLKMAFSIVQSTMLFDTIVLILCRCTINTELYAVDSIVTDLLAMLNRKEVGFTLS
jgi:hypothetical protein